MSNDTVGKTIFVAVALCVVCSVIVSTAAVSLKPMQVLNKERDLKRNILLAAGIYEDGVSVEQQFEQVQVRLVDIDSGTFSEAVDVASYDQRKAAKDPQQSEKITAEQDIAKLQRREQYATVYLIETQGKLEKVVLPIRGYGLWSTLYGFMAVKNDGNTVAGLGFYEHAETPGLGGEVDNPSWKAKWVGKKIYKDDQVELTVVKGRGKGEHQVDGLSGATLTSRGVANLVKYWLGSQGFGPFLSNLKKGEA